MEHLDVAIVGGGASGIYTAWRLINASATELESIRAKIGGEGPLAIGVFERSARVGGRLLSASPASMPTTTMEIGGMRYLSTQPLVKGLVENKLNVKRHEQIVDVPTNLAYLRGRLFRQNELDRTGTTLPYGLTEAERMVITTDGTTTPAQLVFWAVFQEFPEINGMSSQRLRSFLQDATVDGKPLYQVGFWNLLSRHLSHEGRQLAITAIGYDVLGANANAVDIIAENFDFTPNSTYSLFDEGFETVFWELASQFEASGGTITMGRTLESFDYVEHDDPSSDLNLEFEQGDDVTARAVVLAMPQAALLALRRRGPVLDPDRAPDVQGLLSSVEGIPLYKLFLVYETPWWNDAWKLTAGRSITDIPVRQCYYWATNANEASAIMCYNDLSSTSFWGGYQTVPLGPRDATTDTVDDSMLFHPDHVDESAVDHDEIVRRRRKNWDDHKAPHEMVMEMHRQLMEMHGVPDAPEPIDAAFMDWMNAPYGGAVHFWNPGHKSWEVHRRMTQPVEDVNVFVVGEAYSTAQTWVEGALQTSEIFLQERMDMSAPDWIDGGGLG